MAFWDTAKKNLKKTQDRYQQDQIQSALDEYISSQQTSPTPQKPSSTSQTTERSRAETVTPELPDRMAGALGQSVTASVISSLAGTPSNNLLRSEARGSEAIARKAMQNRGMAGEAAAQAGIFGQGASIRAQQQTEYANMQALGDFRGQMGQLAAQEQQQAVQNATALLGVGVQADQTKEMVRHNMMTEAIDKEMNLIDKLAVAEKYKSPEMAAALISEMMGADFDAASSIADQEKLMEVQNYLQMYDNNPDVQEMFEARSDGIYFQGEKLTGGAADAASVILGSQPGDDVPGARVYRELSSLEGEELSAEIQDRISKGTVTSEDLQNPQLLEHLEEQGAVTIIDRADIGVSNGGAVTLNGEAVFSHDAIRAKGLKSGDLMYVNGEWWRLGRGVKRTWEDEDESFSERTTEGIELISVDDPSKTHLEFHKAVDYGLQNELDWVDGSIDYRGTF